MPGVVHFCDVCDAFESFRAQGIFACIFGKFKTVSVALKTFRNFLNFFTGERCLLVRVRIFPNFSSGRRIFHVQLLLIYHIIAKFLNGSAEP